MSETDLCPRCNETFDHMPYVACCVHDGRAAGRLHPWDPFFGRANARMISELKRQLSTPSDSERK